ncbi:MAG: indolepyruvate oxidoreductase subunit beta [Gemmatimonadota bacterium]|nr:indolepyruvate oxidoreductase subunit beta [Gemmatimonadota bacterium]MDH3368257.1 indolepyruvate oxidoreductase subunit beta [Gemmatimonadota bacterium]MDH3478780.1 indolepyruvate oxidoreductase subunit beta [Gemmatimonadota bacterium]MDH3568843.1 indolepyruvate oxidoreductase subunit beta [Gemmatimonadota bacterium]MDH5550830.1 indolepyruvate oxidoreductase subunit beta [Gemmatimonadota bacterium]
MPVTNVLIAGVGGQGTILASELLAMAAMTAGYDVKQGEFHGVAQRGGSVFSHVRFGERVYSPMAPRGSVDYMLALEQLEALRYAHFVKPTGTVLVNDHRVEPIRVADERPYPENAMGFLGQQGFRVVMLDATRTALELGNYRAANAVLLGALAEFLEIPGEVWERTLEERVPTRLLELNRRAFAAGRTALTRAGGSTALPDATSSSP